MTLTVADLGIGAHATHTTSQPQAAAGADPVLQIVVTAALNAGVAPGVLAAAMLDALGEFAPVAWRLTLSPEVAGQPETLPVDAFDRVNIGFYEERFQPALEAALCFWIDPDGGVGRIPLRSIVCRDNLPAGVELVLAKSPTTPHEVLMVLADKYSTDPEALTYLSRRAAAAIRSRNSTDDWKLERPLRGNPSNPAARMGGIR